MERNKIETIRKIIWQISEYFQVDKNELKFEFLINQIILRKLHELGDIEILKFGIGKVLQIKTIQDGE